MIENYKSRYYDTTHNCFLLHLNGRTLFDPCGNMFMAKHGTMIIDESNGNIVLDMNKLKDSNMEGLYQKSPYKWIERDAPLRYLESFRYRILKPDEYPDSSFFNYGYDVDIMIPAPAWCASPSCEKFFPDDVLFILDNEADNRACRYADCHCCPQYKDCPRHWQFQPCDYISLIHAFIHGKLTSIHDLSLYIGDQLFDNAEAQQIFLWSPIIIYIIKQVLKIQ